MGKEVCLEIGKTKFNAEYLRSVSEETAVSSYAHLQKSKVVNAWKQANGKTVRNNRKTVSKKKNKESSED